MKHLLAFALLLAAPLSACAPAKPQAWSFYDQCAEQAQSFLAMAECGRRNITAYCQANHDCSPNDNSFVLYTDSLVRSIKNGEMTEAEAQRRWIEFRMAQVNAYQQRIQSAPRPVTCFGNGPFLDCF